MNIQTIARDSWLPDDHPEVKRVDFHELIATSDVISLHCPLTPETQFLISEGELARMKPSAFLLNTSRGPLIDERALADALMDGKIAGAGIDVVELEPPRSESLLYQAPNCFITPHIAWATSAARKRLMQTAIDNVQGYLSGQLQHIVNP
jgi:glycerate dehydrogenase